MNKIKTANWYAWVNKQPLQPTSVGTLHVIGDVDTQSPDFAFLSKKIPQGFNPDILLLDLNVQTGFIPAQNPQKVHYTEFLTSEKQYDSIEIFHKNEKITTIDTIDEVH